MGGGDYFYLFIGVITLFIYGREWLLYLLIYFSLFLKTSFLYIYILQALQIKVFSCREFNFKNYRVML